jgi:hypothetical protein
MSRSNSSNFAESLAELISEQVSSVVDDLDLSDKIQEELPDFEELVEKAVDNFDIDDKVSDAVSEAMDEYDFSEKVEKEVEKELEANLNEYVENEFETYSKTDKFKELVMAEVNRVLEARDAAAKVVADAKRAKLVDYVKCGPLRRWLGNWGSWY